MAAPTTTSEAIQQTALGPKRVQVAGESVEQQSIDELIKADQYLNSNTVGSKVTFGLRFTKLIPPGAGG